MPFLAINLWQLLRAVQQRAIEFFAAIWSGNYSAFQKELWGISLVDVIGLFIGLMLLWEFLKVFFSIFSDIVKALAMKVFEYLWGIFLSLLRKALGRIKATLLFLWNTERIQAIIHRIRLLADQVFHRFRSRP